MPQHVTSTSFAKGSIPWNKGKHTGPSPKRGIPLSKETKLKISISQLGHTHPTTDETRRKLSTALKGREFSQEHRLALSKAAKAQMADPSNRPMYGRHHTKATRSKMSLAKKGKYNGELNPMYGQHRPEEFCQLLSKLKIEQYQDPLEREKLSEKIKHLWTDPNYIAKVMKGRSVRPTKPERILIDILGKHLPEFGYNGDFSLGIVIAGLIPDFVNVNGKKEVIEVFGDYFHSGKIRATWHASELGRIMAYNSLGYRCLVIWEHELYEQPESEITDKIRRFFRG